MPEHVGASARHRHAGVGRPQQSRGPAWIAGAYALGAILWVALSTYITTQLAPDAGPITRVELVSNGVFALATAAALWWLIQRSESELREASHTIERLNDQLEHRVAERTARLEAANEELRAFSYSASHDLTEPIVAIEGLSRMLIGQPSLANDPGSREIAERIHRAAAETHGAVKGLFDLSHVTQLQMSRERVNLASLAREILDNLRSRQPTRRAKITVHPDLVVRGDPTLLRIMLTNLLGNAWKFTSHLTWTEIEVGRMRQGSLTAFYVRDNGLGFNMADADRLFKPYERLHPEKGFKGTGVGLATVKRVIDRHGGRVWAVSPPHGGATFYFTL